MKHNNEGCPTKIVLELPAGCKRLAEALTGLADQLSRRVGGGPGRQSLAKVEHEIADVVARVEAEAVGVVLATYDVDAPAVSVDGRRYRRLCRESRRYFTLAGPVEVERTVYRAADQRNGPTLDALANRAGLVEGAWTPACGSAMAHAIALGTGREAQLHAERMHRLPYSRSSFERIGRCIGALYDERKLEIEGELMERFDVPKEATSVSVSLDRVAVPMEEIADDGEGVARRFRMAHTGTLTFHRYDGENVESLHVIRYGRMAGTEVGEMDYSLHSDLVEVLAQRPDLDLVALADGADELWARLDAITDGLKPEATRLVDFWHVCEYLAQAAGSVLDESEAGAKLEHWKKRLVSSPWAASTIIGELGQWNTQAAKDAKRYLENHKDRMNYADARRVGLPIGSGSVEASCKSLVALRFKRCGSRWKRDTGDAVVQLRALLLSDRWVPGMTEILKPLRRRVRKCEAA